MASPIKSILSSGLEFLRQKHKQTKSHLEGIYSERNGEELVEKLLGPVCDRMIDEIVAECVHKALTEAPSEPQTRVPSPAKPAFKETEVLGKRGRKAPMASSGKQTSTTICPNCDSTTKVLEFISHLEFCMFNEKQGSQRVINNLKRKSSANHGFCSKKNPRRGVKKKPKEPLESEASDQSLAVDSVETPLPGYSYSTPKKKGKHSKSPK